MAKGKKSNIFAAVGAATGLGNALRFPALCVSYGAAFILAYFAVLVTVCFPLMCAELYLGWGRERRSGRVRKQAGRNGAKLLAAVMRLAAANSALIALYYGVIASKMGGACLSFAVFGRADAGGASGADGWHIALFAIAAVCVLAAVYALLKGGARSLSKSGKLSVALSLIMFPSLAVAGVVHGNIFTSFNPAVLASGALWADALGQALLALSLASGVMPALARAQKIKNVPLTGVTIIAANFAGCLAAACATLPFVAAFPDGGGINVALTVYPQVIAAVAPNAISARFLGVGVYAVLTVVAVHSLCSLALPALGYLAAKIKHSLFLFCVLAAILLPVFALYNCRILNACDRMACSVNAIIIAFAECLVFVLGKRGNMYIGVICLPACAALALFSLCSARFGCFAPIASAAAFAALAAVLLCGFAPFIKKLFYAVFKREKSVYK